MFCWQSIEYAECIPWRGVRPHPLKKEGCLEYDSTPNGEDWDLENVWYSFIAITPRSILIRSCNTC